MPRQNRSRPSQFRHPEAHRLNLIRKVKGKDSIRLRRKIAAWDDEFLASIVAA